MAFSWSSLATSLLKNVAKTNPVLNSLMTSSSALKTGQQMAQQLPMSSMATPTKPATVLQPITKTSTPMGVVTPSVTQTPSVKIPTSLPATAITNSAPIKTATPQSPQVAAEKADSFVNGITNSANTYNTGIKNQMTYNLEQQKMGQEQQQTNALFQNSPSLLENERGQIKSSLENSQQQLMGKRSALEQKQAELGIPEQTQQLKDLNLQIAQLTGSYNKGLVDVQGKVIPMQFITGQQAQMRQQAAAELGALSSVQQALQGNIALSQQTAEQAIAMEFEPIEQQINAYKEQLSMNWDELSREDKKLAEQRAYEIDQAQAQIDAAKEERKNIMSIATQAASGGAGADLVRQMLSADSMESALEIASPYLTTGGGELKKVTINGVDYFQDANGNLTVPDVPSTVGGNELNKTLSAMQLVENSLANAEKYAGASGRSGLRKGLEEKFIGATDFTNLVAETNTLRTNVLTMMTDPNIKKFFGPQMSNADVQLMTSAGTTLNPELQSPENLKAELARLKDFVTRAKQAVLQGQGNEDPLGLGFNQPLSKGLNGSVEKISSAIGQFESGGNYKAIGPKTSSGDRAYGKYQIMGNNIPSWSKEVLGKSITKEQFMANPKLQDQIAQYKMKQYYDKYGTVGDVASMWFSGRPVAKAGNAKDVLGTSVPKYVSGVVSIYNKNA